MADLTDRLLGENFEEAFGDVELNNVYDLAATFRAIRTLHARLRTAKVEGAAEAYETVCREVTYAPAYTNMLSQRAAAIRKGLAKEGR